MLPVLFEEDHGQKARAGKAARRNVKGRRCLADLLAGPAGKFLADVLDHLPLPGDDLERLGDVFAELRKSGRAAARASGRPGTITRSRGRCRGNGLRTGLRRVCSGTSVVSPPVFAAAISAASSSSAAAASRSSQLELHLIQDLLIDKLASAFGTAAIELPPHLLDGELEMGDQRLGAGDIGRRPRGCSLSARSLRLGVNARDALGGKEPLEVFQIVGRPFVRHHDRKWSTDRAIRDLGIDKMSQNATGSSHCFRPPCALRMSPVNALQHIGELRRRDDNNAIGRRGPDKLAALQPLA